MRKLTIAALALLALAAPAAPAQASERLTPAGVVTKAEFDQAQLWMTSKEVRELYGARPHFLVSWWGPRGNWHGAFKYRAEDGTWTDATFVDRNDDGVIKLIRKNWY